jgi:predicted phosphodiesterase
MLHDLARLDLKPEAAGFHVVVYGHSHQPKIEEKNGVLYFNPGSAGPRRFHLPVSVGKLRLASGNARGKLLTLDV